MEDKKVEETKETVEEVSGVEENIEKVEDTSNVVENATVNEYATISEQMPVVEITDGLLDVQLKIVP